MNTIETGITGGKWQRSKDWIVSQPDAPNGPYVKICKMASGSADSDLIVSAKELLGALQEITNISVSIDEKNGAQRAWIECVKIARAAITKAEKGGAL